MAEINKLMVVAHPDDEIIFGGDELIQEKGWKVICISEGNNDTRSQEFKAAMKKVEAEYEIWSFKDAWTEHVNRPKLEQELQRIIHERPYRKIVTHNLQGEYGHPEHKALSEIMNSIVKENLFMFDLSLEEVLQVDILKQKLEILEVYESQKHAVEQLIPYVIKARSIQVK
ncbi:PIG-L family deacetylase [Fictibacillus sp. B-59209]|uniref:PIG-L family deacetylase n=1 Tax=Fictibacillus sp. B-59209 TaxID=3024873 RepID=UPI002E24EB1B|nr:PIG-L family deacetylase [Fictibacillus sp. B-59209]